MYLFIVVCLLEIGKTKLGDNSGIRFSWKTCGEQVNIIVDH